MTSTTITSPEMLADCVREAHELTELLRDLVQNFQLNSKSEAPSQPLRLPQVLEKTATKKSTLYAMIKRGEFAAPYHHGRSSRWRQCDVDAWLRATNQLSDAGKDTEVRA